MRIPVINTDQTLFSEIVAAVSQVKGQFSQGERAEDISLISVESEKAAIDHINYQTPPLLALNFSDDQLDVTGIMTTISADPWLNNGGIIVFYRDSEDQTKLETFQQNNIIISLPFHEIKNQLGKVLGVVGQNRQMLFHRAIQADFAETIYGRHLLELDTLIIPCYANLIGNYLFNMGFIEPEARVRINLSLTEMLMNAIEHGSCGIQSAEKTGYLAKHGSIAGLIAERAADERFKKRKVTFQYDIQRSHSTFYIEDEGAGFDWRPLIDKDREVDIFAQHGRGILLTLNSMDEISFNERGNAVTMRLEHLKNTTNTVPAVFQDQDILVVSRGDEIFRQGEASDFLYYVAEGEYHVIVNQKHVATITPSDILLGEMSFLLDETRSATVIAAAEGRLIKISKAAFINNIRSQPYYGLFLAKLLAQRLDRMGRAVSLG